MRRLSWLAVFLCAGGCAEAASPMGALPPADVVETPPPATSPPAPPPLGAHTLPRSAVRAALGHGLGAFLQHVDLDDQPALVGGKFHGFRIVSLHDAAFWNGVDLRPGDVVTSVNGFPIERPEQAQKAFDSLEVASELRVAYDRDGQPRVLVYAIADDR
jgi:type II secretory pathway component PulC